MSGTDSVPAVEVLSVEKTYPNGTHALQPVNLTVQEGEFVTLLGPSGCGKSTLLKMVAGLLEPSNGRLLLWRKPVEQIESTGHRLSFVFQEPTLMPWARVQANVRLPLDLAGVPAAEAEPARARVAGHGGPGQVLPATCRASCRAACRCACPSPAGWSRSRRCC